MAFAPGDANAAVARGLWPSRSRPTASRSPSTPRRGAWPAQDPPDDGVLTTVGPLGVGVTDGASFDISAAGAALLASPG